MKVYIIERDCSSGMGGLAEEWAFNKIFSSQQKALDYFYTQGYDSKQFKCKIHYYDDTDDLYTKWGRIMRMQIQDKDDYDRDRPYYLREIEVE